MTFRDSIRQGIRLTHENWQLIVVQLVVSIISCIMFFIIMGIPVVIAVVSMGLDASELLRLKELLNTVKDPTELVGQYFAFGVILVSAFLFYLLVVFSIWMYVFSGSAGVISRALRQPHYGFKLKEFFEDAKRLFFPITGYMTIAGLIFMAGLFAFGIIAGGIAAIAAFIDLRGMSDFLKIFIALFIITAVALFTFAAMAVTFYGAAILVFKGTGVMETLKRTFRYIKSHPASLGLYALTVTGFLVINIVFVLISFLFRMTPVIGSIVMLPYQFFLTALQGYLNVAVLAIVFVYFYFTSEGSTCPAGISPEEAPVLSPPPQASDETG